MYLQLIFFFLKSRIFKQLLISCFTTVSDKNSWDTLTKRCFFPSRAPLVPLKVVYRGSVTKFCTPTLRGQGYPKCPNHFDWDCSTWRRSFFKKSLCFKSIAWRLWKFDTIRWTPGQCYFELWWGKIKRRLNLNHFGKFLQIFGAVFSSK